MLNKSCICICFFKRIRIFCIYFIYYLNLQVYLKLIFNYFQFYMMMCYMNIIQRVFIIRIIICYMSYSFVMLQRIIVWFLLILIVFVFSIILVVIICFVYQFCLFFRFYFSFIMNILRLSQRMILNLLIRVCLCVEKVNEVRLIIFILCEYV